MESGLKKLRDNKGARKEKRPNTRKEQRESRKQGRSVGQIACGLLSTTRVVWTGWRAPGPCSPSAKIYPARAMPHREWRSNTAMQGRGPTKKQQIEAPPGKGTRGDFLRLVLNSKWHAMKKTSSKNRRLNTGKCERKGGECQK